MLKYYTYCASIPSLHRVYQLSGIAANEAIFICLGKDAICDDFDDDEHCVSFPIVTGLILVVTAMTAAILLIFGSVLSTQNG